MCDPIRQVVANVHSGWRGSIINIIGRTVNAMEKHFGCDPAQIQAGIGPSLGPCCAEFVNYETEIPEKFWHHKDAGHHFDFWSISQDQLMDAGVLKANIENCQICTKCHTDLFFSYRGEGTTGRFASVIGLKQDER
jgi:copper oxidase (laccase) domain-containing protein